MTRTPHPRTIDHLVLPVADVEKARQRYQQLGFTVAPTGVHPFGTENCCIFFRDGTFLEPLGIAHRETCEAQALKGHTFVANDQTYRFRRGTEGFSHLVIKSDDARSDDKDWRGEAISGGKMVKFSRKFKTPSGESGKVSFLLAFAADRRSPDAHFFSCQVIDPPKVDRSALMAHENGVLGLGEVILCEENPTDFQYFFQTYLNQREMDVDSFGMGFETGNARVSVLTPDGLRAFYGLETSQRERGMLFEAFVLKVQNLSTVTTLLKKNGIDMLTRGKHLLIPPAVGQGTTIILEEAAQ